MPNDHGGFDLHITSVDDFIKFVNFIRGVAQTEEEVRAQIDRIKQLDSSLQNAVNVEKN